MDQRDEVESLRTLTAALREHVSALEDENHHLKHEVEDAQLAGRRLMEKLQQKDKKIVELSERVKQSSKVNDDERDERVNKLLADNAFLQKNVDVEVNAALAEKERAKHHLSLESEKNAKLMDTMRVTASKLEQSENEIRRLEALLEEGKPAIRKELAMEMAAKYEPTIEDYRVKQAALMDGIEELESKFKHTEDRLEDEKKDLINRVGELEHDLEARTADLERENERLELEARTTAASNDDMRARLAVQESLMAQAVHETEANNASLEAELAELSAHTNMLDSELRVVRAEKVGLKARVADLENTLATLGGDASLDNISQKRRDPKIGPNGEDLGGMDDDDIVEIDLGDGHGDMHDDTQHIMGHVRARHAPPGSHTLTRTDDGAHVRPRSAAASPDAYSMARRRQSYEKNVELDGRIMQLEQALLDQRTMMLRNQRDMKEQMKKSNSFFPSTSSSDRARAASAGTAMGGLWSSRSPETSGGRVKQLPYVNAGGVSVNLEGGSGVDALSAWYQNKPSFTGASDRSAVPRAPSSAPTSAYSPRNKVQGQKYS